MQLGFDMDTGFLACDCGSGSPLNSPIIWDTWVELRVDLDADTVDLYYNGTLEASHLWSEGPFGADMHFPLKLGAVDLYPDSVGGTPSPVYFDSFTLVAASPTNCLRYCTAGVNSVGSGALISATDGCDGTDGMLSIQAAPVPNQPGLFFHGANQAAIPFGCGSLCTTGGIVRGGVVIGSGQVATYDLDVSLLPPGDVRNVQFWYRDPAYAATCGSSFNTSDGIENTN